MKDSLMLLGDSIEFDATNGVLVVRVLREKIVYPPLPTLFSAAVMHGVDRHPGLDVILDLIWVRYLSSAALAELRRIQKHLSASGRSLYLCHVDADIMEILRLTHLDKLFVTARTMKEATCLLRNGKPEEDVARTQTRFYPCHEPVG
ncbi:MAG: STAS domain-containing protein [Candidatus Hydrogenedentes bacterium]|nr:STAS domain-containing protein [Candidatus Hydrogenedentota bacterium]